MSLICTSIEPPVKNKGNGKIEKATNKTTLPELLACSTHRSG